MKKKISITIILLLILTVASPVFAVTISGKKTTVKGRKKFSRLFTLRRGVYRVKFTHKTTKEEDKKQWVTMKIYSDKYARTMHRGRTKIYDYCVCSMRGKGDFEKTREIKIWDDVKGRYIIHCVSYGPWKVILKRIGRLKKK